MQLISFRHTKNWFCLSILLLGLLSQSVQAEMVIQQMEKGLNATAEFLPGDSDKPVILILHGFLQTRDFYTVRRLADALHESGYTLLLPNLTLGISGRKSSLPCEAIHTHSFTQDIHEVDQWIHWLNQHTKKEVTLIGHSTGSLLLTGLLSEHSHEFVDQAILISLTAFGQGPIAKENQQEIEEALKAYKSNPSSLAPYRLSYCEHYLTTAENYLSYVNWNVEKMLTSLQQIKTNITVILGSVDERLGPNWVETLKEKDIQVEVLAGANHFFDSEYEFDLLDHIETLLN